MKISDFFLSWDVVIGEAHILERALYYIFQTLMRQN